MPVSLSLAMIVKNEQDLLRRALQDVREICDEMVVLDTGSTDDTMTIAAEEGAVVQQLAWRGDFAAARNASFAWCSCDWILWLDADDVLPESTKHTIVALKDSLSDNLDMVLAPYRYRISDDGAVVLNLARERLIRRAAGLRWQGSIRESIPIPKDRSTLTRELVVEHRPSPERRAKNLGRDLRMLEQEMASGRPWPQTIFHYANELYDHQRFQEAARHFREYLTTSRRPSPDRYWATLHVAEAERALGRDQAAILPATRALALDPSRAEVYVTLARLHFDHERWAQAMPLFVAATACRAPDVALSRSADYQYLPWDYLSVCLDRLGRRPEALIAAERALPGNPQSDRVRANMQWMTEAGDDAADRRSVVSPAGSTASAWGG
jgi:tetratricopeptide (TPR) repeat protein